ncbi:LOW QUALITY PROTEIN: beta-galactosidase [Elysia marginata]|uniref:Beta-galactosidase n=1 Tax=Elysia marginata TaxID=1093978 RepID=A0AAV4JEV4_9GAST|nr:LOW QUALITY PROTEIN: beta-galactosidase [Elysia marginata]
MATATNLSFKDGEFLWQGKPLRIFSGAIHYFRTVPEYWQDRLEKAKACGLNTIETYVPWNLHEPRPGHYKNEGILDLRRFIKLASNLGLYVIFRPGPYICSEWDFGGLPSWLLGDPEMKVRSNYKGYQDAVKRYFSWLLPQITDLQSSQGGPIFAVQVENEYGSFSFDPAHLLWLRDLLWESGITELLVTSDNETCARGLRALSEGRNGGKAEDEVDLFNIPGVLPTANGMTVDELRAVFAEIRRERRSDEKAQSGGKSRPLMVMELWSGWFDYWGAPIHETTTAQSLLETVRYAFSQGSSINLYMFHGGTNFGFMNGALQLPPNAAEGEEKQESSSTGSALDVDSFPYRPDVTSYDYDAPLTEDGCITGKFLALREIIEGERKKDLSSSSENLPDVPRGNCRAQSPLVVEGWAGNRSELSGGLEKLAWDDLLALVTKRAVEKEDPKWMESYVFGDGAVQSYGYIVYRKKLESGSRVKNISFTGRVRDLGNVLVNGKSRASIDWSVKDGTVSLQQESKNESAVLDIVVENLGLTIDGKVAQEWEVLALDFEDGYIMKTLASANWVKVRCSDQGETVGPALYRGVVRLTEETPADYFVRLEGWHKGVLFVNGFNLGRYWNKGPTRTLYVPGPVLRKGDNQVVVFEEEGAGGQIVFGIEPHLG